MAHITDSDQHKRKREVSDDNGSQAPHADRIPQPPPPQSVPINYLSRAHSVKLKLIQGDGDTISDVLTLINEYEGVLNRHESLASNLGAKLTGSRLLKAMEGAFEGSITTIPPQTVFTSDPITWLDIVEFAKSKPGEFTLTPTLSGTRCCQFSLKGVQVEISEDDWRLIVSGALDRLVPSQPLEEDETAELVTLDIVEQRLQILIKKADEVARRARQLNYHLSGRKVSIYAHRSSQSAAGPSFQAINQSRPSAANPGYDLHADLLQQFLAPSQPSSHRMSSASSMPPTPNPMASASTTPRVSIQQQQPLLGGSRPSPGYPPEPIVRDVEEENRALVTAKIEKLARGDFIHPPCDRCRRLKTQCIKHLTACQGCTKKHARCVWKGLTEGEVTWLKGEATRGPDDGGDERRGPGSGGFRSRSHPELGESRMGSERSEEAGTARPGSRIAIGRRADEVWRKEPESSASRRHDSMDVDTRDIRQEQVGKDGPGLASREQHSSLLSHMASVASAAADAAAASRGSQRHP
ncbi:hypothetical protein F4779DRAFT_626165 [Xylariaceae sp. FL0662B]|nr:hypothetical protein F4779DRAFT_626165 [Xylariaceae sp. FL0662B]